MLALRVVWAPLVTPLRDILEPSRYDTTKNPKHLLNPTIAFPYMKLILRTIPKLIVISLIPFETLKNL
jgi:hypothetical protein